jgi:hypothetical protein
MKVSHIVIIALLLLILYQVTMRPGRSFMADLGITSGSGASSGPDSIFGLKNSLKCTVGGYNQNSAYYTKSLTPGGLCGDEDYVRNQQRDFSINSGIGGSLLTK